MSKVLQSLGLCKRANKLVSGESFVLEKIKSGEAKLVFLASDAGPNTTKRISDKSKYYKVELVHQFSTDELNTAIGKTNRKAIAILDKKFATLILKQLDI